jgi:hypothetical protein
MLQLKTLQQGAAALLLRAMMPLQGAVKDSKLMRGRSDVHSVLGIRSGLSILYCQS